MTKPKNKLKKAPGTAALFQMLKAPPPDSSADEVEADFLAQCAAKLPVAFAALEVDPRAPDAEQRLLYAALGMIFTKGFRFSKSLSWGEPGSKGNDTDAFLAVRAADAVQILEGKKSSINKAVTLVPYSVVAKLSETGGRDLTVEEARVGRGITPEDLRRRERRHPDKKIADMLGSEATVLWQGKSLKPLKDVADKIGERGHIAILWGGKVDEIPESLATGFVLALPIACTDAPISSLPEPARSFVAAAARGSRYGIIFIDRPDTFSRGNAFVAAMAGAGLHEIPIIIADADLGAVPTPCIVIAEGREQPMPLFR